MDKNELLKYLICEIDLVMHDKDYRFENEDGTWYSRESCKNLTNEEVFEELKSELRQLAKIEDDFADLEAKLAESEKDVQKYRQHLEISNKKVIDMDKSWTKDVMELEEQIDQLKQQLADKDQAIEGLQEINQSLGQTCNNDAKEIERLREQLAEKENQYNQLIFNSKYTNEEMIDFAVEQLENVKDKINVYKKEHCLLFVEWDVIEKAVEFIDQQITQLKGEK